ncbi:MAG: hypothetical protein LBQ90_10615 [Synergistaceae bacterium]|jgi:hypothetical protein|nr:hypothetical protein [Synergistaceae bacterium]
MKTRTGKAFSFAELLITLTITSILGGAAVIVLWFAFGIFSQSDAYMTANAEMELAIQRLGREFTLIGLGMPNNRKGAGSFASAFAYPTRSPIMALMGTSGGVWGGPVTVGKANPSNVYDVSAMQQTTLDGGDVYVGPELYYAWAVPTGVRAFTSSDVKVHRGATVTVTELLSPSGPGRAFLENFRYDGRLIGLTDDAASRGRNPASWLLFPTLRIPLLMKEWTADGLRATLAADAGQDMEGVLTGLDEVHLLQAARLYLSPDGELVQVIFGSDYTDESTSTIDVLAHNIVGLQFAYNAASRLLTMYIAARGNERDAVAVKTQPGGWPSWLPPIASDALSYRVATKAITWRIRN